MKSRYSKTVGLAIVTAIIIFQSAAPAIALIDPVAVRNAAVASGMQPLAAVPVPVPDLAAEGIVVDQAALVQLGKAFFWDQQIGSDGQACGTCHFEAGIDTRTKNQINPNLANAVPDPLFGNSEIPGVPGFPAFAPNYTLVAADFPLHKIDVADQNNFDLRVILQSTNDVISSQGVFNADFVKVAPGLNDKGTPIEDAIFNVAGINTRRIEPRNTPTFINAIFNFANFWDGRAHNTFNGVDPFGPLNPDATILVLDRGFLFETPVALPNSSLASLATGPPLSVFEMSFAGRTHPDIGKKVIKRKPLAFQRVHPDDSILGPLAAAKINARTGALAGRRGIKTTYKALIQQAFDPKFWDSKAKIGFNADGTRFLAARPPRGQTTYTMMEANFSFFFGLAVQAYFATQVADDTPFDRFMAGDDAALTQEQLQGLLVFLNQGSKGENPLEVIAAIAQAETDNPGVVIGAGNCINCHNGSEMTQASVTETTIEPIGADPALVIAGGLLQIGVEPTIRDAGFFGTGVVPTTNDIGRGGLSAAGFPLSFSQQALDGLFGQINPDPLAARAQVNGAFKVPGLRNVELTGPYFHNGGKSTLSQVIDFYDSQSDFAAANVGDIYIEMVFINLQPADKAPLVSLMLGLTDERVRNKLAPFDHPQILIPNGHPGDTAAITETERRITFQALTDFVEIPAVGAGGLPAEGLPPVGSFLGLPPI